MFGQTKPLTVGETIAILAKLPTESLLHVCAYTDDFSIIEGTHIHHLSAIGEDGTLTFFSSADFFVPAERDDRDEDKAEGELAVEPEDSLSRDQEPEILPDWEAELIASSRAPGE